MNSLRLCDFARRRFRVFHFGKRRLACAGSSAEVFGGFMNEIIEFFKVGEKVRVCGNQGFEIGVTGTIAYPPKVSILSEDFGGNYFRKAQTLIGEKVFVWVVFDNLQYDADGDGPYSETEINIDFLEIIEG